MKKNICIATLLIFSITFFSCKKDKNQKISTTEVEFTKEGELTLFNMQDTIPKTHTTLDIEIADNDYERQTGLMYRKSMQDNQAMLFISEVSKPQSFYMKNTLISLDIIYINNEFKIVSVQKNAKPLDKTSLPSGTPAKYVLEINGGLFDQWNIKVGDSISYTTK